MSLPYGQATSGAKAMHEVERVLRLFGCSKIGSMVDDGAGELIVQFEHRGRQVSVRASFKGYAAAWLNLHPGRGLRGQSALRHAERAKATARIAVYSIVRDWIKGQITAIETGVLSFEGAFLGQLLLQNGKTVLDAIEAQKLLPPVARDDNVRKLSRNG